MKTRWLIAWCALALVLIVFLLSNRYTLHDRIMIDRLTGRSWVLVQGGWKQLQSVPATGPRQAVAPPKTLPADFFNGPQSKK